MKIEMNVTLLPLLSISTILVVLAVCAMHMYKKLNTKNDLYLTICFFFIALLPFTIYWANGIGELKFWSKPYLIALLSVLLTALAIRLTAERQSMKQNIALFVLVALLAISSEFPLGIGGTVTIIGLIAYGLWLMYARFASTDFIRAIILIITAFCLMIGHIIKTDSFIFLFSLMVVIMLLNEVVIYFDRVVRLLRNAGINSFTDPLTKLHNKGYLFKKIDKLLEQGEVNVIFSDIDNFKQLNDTKGHEFGDKVLIKVANVLKEVIGSNGVATRYGGEEMVGLVVTGNAREIAEQFRAQVEKEVGVTVSVGVASSNEVEPGAHLGERIIKKSDHRMYAGKKNGKNRVVYADDDIVFTPENN